MHLKKHVQIVRWRHSRLIPGFVTRLTRRVPPVEQELLTLPEHMSSPPVFTGVRVTRSLVLYVCFVDRCLSFCTFSFGHCVVCSTSKYGFRLPLWYLQTLLTHSTQVRKHSQVTEQIGCNKVSPGDCCLAKIQQCCNQNHDENKLLCNEMWWCLLCTGPIRLVEFL